MNDIKWNAVIYDEEDDLNGSYIGTIRFVPDGQSFSESIRFKGCHCDEAAYARITIKWKNKKGRTCYEWCTIYL